MPSFPKMALCALEIQSDPSPLGCFVPWELMLGSPLALSVLITFYAPLSGFCLDKTTRGWFKTISHRINLKIFSCLNVFQTCCVTMPGLKVKYFHFLFQDLAQGSSSIFFLWGGEGGTPKSVTPPIHPNTFRTI